LAKLTDEQITELIKRLNNLTDDSQSDLSSSVERGSSGGSSSGGSAVPLSTSNLDFIQRDDLREKVASILTDRDASHNDRCWLAGWLYAAAGLSEREITQLIYSEAQWGNCDREAGSIDYQEYKFKSRSSS
jgi:hypothetical protein